MNIKTYSITRTININADQVFKVVSDFNNYEKWNSIVPSGKGELKKGVELKLRMKVGNKTKPFNPKVISIQKGKSFTLSKIILFKEIGELSHRFEFKSISDDKTEFIQTWTGKGWLVKMMWSKIAEGFSDFEIFNDDLENYLMKQQ